MSTTRNQLLAMMLAVITLTSFCTFADDGIVRVKSMHNVSETINKLEMALINKGMTIFKRISHSDGAAKVDLKLRPTELLIFGNPKVGTPLMQCEQTTALDLPQKALAYEDENGQVWLIYNDPEYIADRYNVENCAEVISKISKALANFARAATE
jgi:uncharacterized protein (DUF302 family)